MNFTEAKQPCKELPYIHCGYMNRYSYEPKANQRLSLKKGSHFKPYCTHCMTVQNTAARLPKDLDLTGIRHCVLSWNRS